MIFSRGLPIDVGVIKTSRGLIIYFAFVSFHYHKKNYTENSYIRSHIKFLVCLQKCFGESFLYIDHSPIDIDSEKRIKVDTLENVFAMCDNVNVLSKNSKISHELVTLYTCNVRMHYSSALLIEGIPFILELQKL